MVATLLQPVELIRVQRRGSAAAKVAVAEMQGWRASHEDAHAIRCNSESADVWVLDGHRGDEVARRGAEALQQEFAPSKDKKCLLPTDKKIEKGIESVDRKLRSELQSCKAGSTVVGAFVAKEGPETYGVKLVNCGDSRAVLVHAPSERKDTAANPAIRLPQQLEQYAKEMAWAADASWLPSWPAMVETIDHKPTNPTERVRIEAAGGSVCRGHKPRIDGNLAVSRGLGDFDFKSDGRRAAALQKVSCVPDVYEVRGLREGALLILACDGLWDVMSSEEAASFVRKRLKKEPDADLGRVAVALIRFCLRLETKDNLTVMIVQLGDGKEWAEIEDEMVGFEKLKGEINEETERQYQNFLRKLSFSSEGTILDKKDSNN